MATTKVSALSAKTSLAGSEELLINDSGTSKKVTATNLLAGVTVADGAISTAKIADDAVTGAKIADDAINSEHIAADSIDAEHLAPNSVNTDAYIDGSISNAHIIDATIAGGKLQNDTVTSTQIAANSVGSSELSDNAVDTAAIGTNAVTTAKITDDAVTAAKLANSINTDIATGVTANTTANAALPKAGGTMTGNTIHNDNVKSLYGTGSDLEIYHDGSSSYIKDVGDGSLNVLGSANVNIGNAADNEYMAKFITDGAAELYHNNSKKIETTANGVTVTGGAVGTMTTDNDGSFAMSASNNFKCTPAGNFALTFTSIVAQSGNILFINSGGHTISAHANTKVDANLLATISTAGTYLLSYFSDGTNVYMTNSAIYT